MFITNVSESKQSIFNVMGSNQLKNENDKKANSPEDEKDVVVEISEAAKKKLKEQEKQKEAKAKMEEAKMLLEQLEEQKKSAEAAKEGMEDIGKILEIARRIAKGDKVPQSDEKKLMEFSNDLYQAVKAAAILNANKKHEEHEALFDDEDENIKEKARALDREQSPSVRENTQTAEVATEEAETLQ